MLQILTFDFIALILLKWLSSPGGTLKMCPERAYSCKIPFMMYEEIIF